MEKTLALKLDFSRDLSYKFRYVGEQNAAEKLRKEIGRSWQVAGHFDFLHVFPINRIVDIDFSRRDGTSYSLGAQSSIVVTPVEPRCFPADFVSQVRCDDGPRGMLLSVVKISLSSVAYELVDSLQGPSLAINAAETLLSEWISRQDPFPQFELCQTLGAPDLVLLALPRNPRDLFTIHRLLGHSRELTLQELRERVKDLGGKPHAEWPDPLQGHAFSIVEPMLSFRTFFDSHQGNDENPYNSQAFRDAEDEVGLRLDFSLRLDCGHERDVLKHLLECQGFEIERASAKDESPLSAWSTFTIRGSLRHLADFVDICASHIFNLAWRSANLIDSVTLIAFRTEFGDVSKRASAHLTPNENAWSLSGDLLRDLKDVEESLTKWSYAFLSDTQQREILAAFQCFRDCFFHHGLVSAVQDLLPFFRQLGRACSLSKYWKRFFREASDFDEDIRTLLSTMTRAVRNRIEDRSLQSDPPVPRTLEHGGCKFVNAYSTIYAICAELFRRADGDPHNKHIAEDHIAVCVCSGSDGKVQCFELFEHFRKFVEQADKPKALLSRKRPANWSARLSLMDISGRTLLRPEMCFVHCLHEAAESSEWPETTRCRELRKVLNSWLHREIWAGVLNDVWAPLENKHLWARREEMDHFVWKLIPVSLTRRYDQQTGAHGSSDVKAVWNKLLATKHPCDYLAEAYWSLRQFGLNRDAWEEVAELQRRGPNPSMGIPLDAHRLGDCIYSREFAAKILHELNALAREFCADIGMWCALDHILGREEKRTPVVRLHDVNMVYESIFLALQESFGRDRNREEVDEFFLQRWALQAAAVSHDSAWPDQIVSWIDQSRHREAMPRPDLAQHYLEETLPNAFWYQFGSQGKGKSLVTGLREFEAYAVDEGRSMRFPGPGSCSDSENLLIHEFAELWRSARKSSEQRMDATQRMQLDRRRVDFVVHFWSQSTRLSFDRVFVNGWTAK